MKKSILLILALASASLFLSGCFDPNAEEASNTVPWGAPASFEGAGPGMPNMNTKD